MEREQTLTPASTAQLRQPDRGACVVCGAIRSRRRVDSATRVLVCVYVFQLRRQPGRQETFRAERQPTEHRKPRSWFRKGTFWMTALPLTARCETSQQEQVTLKYWENFAGPQQCHSLGRKRSSALGNFVPLSVQNCCGRNPNGCDRNEEMQRRLQMWEAGEAHDLFGRVLGQQHARQQAAAKDEASDPRTTRKTCLCSVNQRIHQQAHERAS